MNSIWLVVLGILTGTVSGLVGIGGGIIIVPALVILFHFSQHTAQGTTLAMLVPPIGILAAWTYYKQGNTDLRVAALIAVGFVLGGLIGAKISGYLPEVVLKRIFSLVLLLVAIKMFLGK